MSTHCARILYRFRFQSSKRDTLLSYLNPRTRPCYHLHSPPGRYIPYVPYFHTPLSPNSFVLLLATLFASGLGLGLGLTFAFQAASTLSFGLNPPPTHRSLHLPFATAPCVSLHVPATIGLHHMERPCPILIYVLCVVPKIAPLPGTTLQYLLHIAYQKVFPSVFWPNASLRLGSGLGQQLSNWPARR